MVAFEVFSQHDLEALSASGTECPLVAPEHRPTLREELAPLPARRALGGARRARPAACSRCWSRSRGERARTARGSCASGPLAFNLRYPDGDAGARRRPRASGCTSSARASTRSSSSRCELPAYKGDVGGVAARRRRARARRAQAALPGSSSRSRRARRASTRSRATRSSSAPAASRASTAASCCCPQPVPGRARRRQAADAGHPRRRAPTRRATSAPAAQLKTPYRSFRFGTEGP